MKTITYDETKFVLVPVKITEDMHAAAVRTIVRCTGNDDFPPSVWSAMLAAAPVAQEGKAVDGTPTGDTVKHIISGVREFYLGLLSRHLPSEAFDLARSADSTYSVYLGVADHFRELLTAQQTSSQVDTPEGGAK